MWPNIVACSAGCDQIDGSTRAAVAVCPPSKISAHRLCGGRGLCGGCVEDVAVEATPIVGAIHSPVIFESFLEHRFGLIVMTSLSMLPKLSVIINHVLFDSLYLSRILESTHDH
jgi:hypothetical protein